MSLTNFARLAAALATFAVTARVLGIERYGLLMLWMSAGSILALVSNFGLVTYLLREIGRQPDKANQLLGETLTARWIVVTITLLFAAILLAWVPEPARLIFLFLTGAMMAEGFTEFFNAGFRASSRYAIETRIALIAAWLYPACVGLTAWLSADVTTIAASYLASRTAIALLTWHRLRQVVGPIHLVAPRAGWRQVREAISYAVDGALSGVFGQLDSLVLNHFLGQAAVGAHQAGMRLFMAGAGFATVLTNVFLPRAAAAQVRGASDFAAENLRLQLAFLVSGGVGGLLLAIAGRWFAPLLFGESFSPVVPLMPWFGLLFMLSFASEAWSISLTAQGLQADRARIHAIYWLFILSIAIFAVPQLGNRGWLLALVIGSALRFVVYAWLVRRRGGSDPRSLGLAIVLSCLFMPFLSLH